MFYKYLILLNFIFWPLMGHAGPQDDAQAAFEQFFPAFTFNNGAAMSALFAPDAQFYGTSSRELVTQAAGVRAYFDSALKPRGTSVKATLLTSTAKVLADNVVAIAGTWQIEREVEGKSSVNGPLRISVVMQRRGERWLIAQFHNSPRPAAP